MYSNIQEMLTDPLVLEISLSLQSITFLFAKPKKTTKFCCKFWINLELINLKTFLFHHFTDDYQKQIMEDW